MKSKILLYCLCLMFLATTICIGKEKIQNDSLADKFSLLVTFSITVPDDCGDEQLAKFVKENEEKFYAFDYHITDKNFAKVSYKLIPGKTYVVKIWDIKNNENLTSLECLKFLQKQEVLLTGAQGLSIVWQRAKEKFPLGKSIVSFDKKKNLWPDAAGYRQVPVIERLDVDKWSFGLDYFDVNAFVDCCLLGICEE